MFNLKNNENDALFDEILQKMGKIKIKFQKMNGTFWTALNRFKSHQRPLLCTYYV